MPDQTFDPGAARKEIFNGLVATSTLTCGACPTQYEGTLRDGRAWYFRYRHGVAALGIGATLDEAIGDSWPSGVRLGDDLDGHLDEEEFQAAFVSLALPRLVTKGGALVPDSTPAPQDNSAPRGLAWFLDRTSPPDGTPPPRTAGEWNRQAAAAFIARHSPKEDPRA